MRTEEVYADEVSQVLDAVP